MAEFEDLLVGSWNDPHMLAACMASLWYLHDSAVTKDGRSRNLYKNRHKPWLRYAVDGVIVGRERATPRDPTGFDPATGLADMTCSIAKEIVRLHRLVETVTEADHKWNRDARLVGTPPRPQLMMRTGVVVQHSMLAEFNASYTTNCIATTSASPPLLRLIRTWVYVDTVAPWRGVTEEAVLAPKKKAKPLPSPVPHEVELAIEACLEANEPNAARQYYDGWRRAQLEPRQEKTT